jgi:hypothetical protein
MSGGYKRETARGGKRVERFKMMNFWALQKGLVEKQEALF